MHFRLAPCALIGFVLGCGTPAAAQFLVEQPLPPAERYRVELGIGFWSPEPELSIRFDGPAGTGSDIDFVQEFGIGKERFREFRGTLKPGRKHKIRFEHIPFKYDAEAVIQRTFVFGGREFTVGAPAATDITWDLWKFGYEWDFLVGPSGYVGVVGDVKYNKISAEVTAAGFGSELAQAKAPVPGVGGIARGYFSKNVSVTGEFSWFKVPDSITEEIDGTLYDFDIYATVNAGPHVGLQGGYRRLVVDYLTSDDAGALKMKGVYFGGLVRF